MILWHLRLRKLRNCFVKLAHMSILQCIFEYGIKFNGPRSTTARGQFQCFPEQIETYFDHFSYRWTTEEGVSEAEHSFLVAKLYIKWHFHSSLHGHLAIHPGPTEHALQVTHAHRLPRWDPTNPPPLRIRSPRGPPEGRPPFPSSFMLGYLNLEEWSDLLIHGRPTTHFSTAY